MIQQIIENITIENEYIPPQVELKEIEEPKIKVPKVKLFIVEFNRPDCWEQCATSWKQMADNRENIEGYFVDNGSPDLEMADNLGELKERGLIDDFLVLDSPLHPASARNCFWMAQIPLSDETDIFVKMDGNLEALPKWDTKVLEYFSRNPKCGCMAVGYPEQITMKHCFHRAYQSIFVRQPIVKQLGGFRSYEDETGVKMYCDDIDYVRASLATEYNSVNLPLYVHHPRPDELKDKYVEKFKNEATLRIRALERQFVEYRKGNYYIGD